MSRGISYCLLIVVAALCSACHQCRWCAVSTISATDPLPFVEPYEVEFRPMLPDSPGTRIVGRFLLQPDSIDDLGDEDCLQEIRRRAAAMGGNVIVYLYPGVDYAAVAYTPELRQENLHANDDLALADDE